MRHGKNNSKSKSKLDLWSAEGNSTVTGGFWKGGVLRITSTVSMHPGIMKCLTISDMALSCIINGWMDCKTAAAWSVSGNLMPRDKIF